MIRRTASLLCFLVISPFVLHEQKPQQADSPEKVKVDGTNGTKTDSLIDSSQHIAMEKYWYKFAEARRAVTHFAWAAAGDHENAGIYTEGGGSYLGVQAVHTVFKQGNFNLEIPPGAQGIQTLFAPTSRPPNGSCLEMGTAYTTLSGHPTSVHIYVYDFCKTPRRFVYAAIVDDAFIQTYTREVVPGNASYQIRIWPGEHSVGGQTKWYAQIFNYSKKEWATLAFSTGVVQSDRTGWSIFETWYKEGQCSRTLKSIQATDISYYDALKSAWVPIVDNMSPLHNSLNRGGNCFVNQDSNNLASYAVTEVGSSHGWRVKGTNH
jgi:hypothetical protein